MKFLGAVSRALSFLERCILVTLLSLMVVLAFSQVILRNVFSTGLFWADPLLRHLVLWVGFVGASLATATEKHINLDILTRFVSRRTTNLFRVATNLFAAAVTAALSRAAAVFVANEQSTGEILLTIGTLEVPAWWMQLIIPIGFGLMAFRFLLRAAEHAFGRGLPPAVPETPTPLPDL